MPAASTIIDSYAGHEFRELAEPYLLAGLRKGIPSLFADVKALYKELHKLETIASIIEEHHAQLSSSSHSSENDPSTYIWTLYFLAQHYSHISQHQKGMEYLDEALSHTPTLPDLLMLKARILKRQGDPYGAARWMDEARLLDLQDRFLNTKCGIYRLRAGMTEEAQEVFGLFTKVCDRYCYCHQVRCNLMSFIMVRKMPRALVLTWRTCNLFYFWSKTLTAIVATEI